MSKKIKLTKSITEQQFDNGYWYANEIKSFAKELDIANSSKLRKDELEKLNETEKPFEKISHARYINFLAEFLSSEKGATRDEAIKRWQQLKKLDLPKEYKAWKKEVHTKKNNEPKS